MPVMKTHAHFVEADSSGEKCRTFAVSAMVQIPIGSVTLMGDLRIPQDAAGLILFAHGSAQLNCEKKLVVVPRATHLFQEPGALEEVARLASEWFQQHFEAHR